MPPVWQIMQSYWQAIGELLGNPLFWLVMALITFQYRKSEQMERAFWGSARRPLLGRVVQALFFGLVGGLIGSLLLTGVGITISIESTRFVMLVSLSLALLNMRYLCFAYSGGLLSLASLIFGWPALDVASLLALIAVLHLVESVLMLLSGHLQAFPVAVRQPCGRTVGGYNLQMFWPLPLLALVFLPGMGNAAAEGGIAMPGWWPLIRPLGSEGLGDIALYMMPLLAGLGYGDLAITMPPKQKARRSAFNLLGYGIILLALAWLGGRIPAFLFVGALYAPLGHELLIVLANRREQTGKPLYFHEGPGLKIMEVIPGGLAQKAGLKPMDLILSANGCPLETVDQFHEIVQGQPQAVLAVRRGQYTTTVAMVLPLVDAVQQMGALMVPDQRATAYVKATLKSPLEPVVDRFFRIKR